MPVFSSASNLSSALPAFGGLQGGWRPPSYLAPAIGQMRPVALRKGTAPSSLAGAFDGLPSETPTSSLVPTRPPPMVRANTTGQMVTFQASASRPVQDAEDPAEIPRSLAGFDLSPLTKQPVTHFNYEAVNPPTASSASLPPPVTGARSMPKMPSTLRTKDGLERTFRCDECPQSFHRGHDLKRHKRIHMIIKPFPCGWCEKTFSRKDALKRHLVTKGCGIGQGQTKEDSEAGVSRAPSLWAKEFAGSSAMSPDSLSGFELGTEDAFDPSTPDAEETSLTPALAHARLSTESRLPSPPPPHREPPPNYLTMPPPPPFVATTQIFQPRAEPSSPSLEVAAARMLALEEAGLQQHATPSLLSMDLYASMLSEGSTPSSSESSSLKSPGLLGPGLPVATLPYGYKPLSGYINTPDSADSIFWEDGHT